MSFHTPSFQRSSFIALWVVGLAACSANVTLDTSYDEAEIKAELIEILEKQDADWSAGDIDAFMESYWKSDQLRFASGGNIERGWEETKARYYRRYPNPDIMGRLISGDHEIDIVAPDAAVVHGSWRLERDGEPASGLYTLVFKEIGGQWVITSDTTTSAQ